MKNANKQLTRYMAGILHGHMARGLDDSEAMQHAAEVTAVAMSELKREQGEEGARKGLLNVWRAVEEFPSGEQLMAELAAVANRAAELLQADEESRRAALESLAQASAEAADRIMADRG